MSKSHAPKPDDSGATAGSPSVRFALAELAEWAQLEFKAADSTAQRDAWLDVRDWARNGARLSKPTKPKQPMPPDTDILEALEKHIPGIIAAGTRWARKANAIALAQPGRNETPTP